MTREDKILQLRHLGNFELESCLCCFIGSDSLDSLLDGYLDYVYDKMDVITNIVRRSYTDVLHIKEESKTSGVREHFITRMPEVISKYTSVLPPWTVSGKHIKVFSLQTKGFVWISIESVLTIDENYVI